MSIHHKGSEQDTKAHITHSCPVFKSFVYIFEISAIYYSSCPKINYLTTICWVLNLLHLK